MHATRSSRRKRLIRRAISIQITADRSSRTKLTIHFRVNNNENDNSGGIRAFPAQRRTRPATYTSPFINRGFNTRGQYALTRNNTLNFNWNYNSRTQTNFGLNEFTLPERGADNKSTS